MADWTWWLVAVVLGITAVIVVVVVLRSQGRARALSALAAQRGLAYTRRDDSRLTLLPGGTFALNVIEGERSGRRFVVFDSDHSEETEEGQTFEPLTVVAVHTGRRLPSLRIDPRQRKLLGGGGGFPTGDQDFDRRYTVTTVDAAFASALLTPPVRAALLKEKCRQFACRHDAVVLATKGAYPVNGLDAAVGRVEGMLADVPGDLWRNLPPA